MRLDEGEVVRQSTRVEEYGLLLRVAAETDDGRAAARLEGRHEVEELRPDEITTSASVYDRVAAQRDAG